MSAPRYERSDAPSKVGWISMALLAGIVGLVLGFVASLLVAFNAAEPKRAAKAAPPRQDPALETSAGEAIAIVRAREAKAVSAYGWTGPDHQAARIPIDRAMQLTAQRGWSDAPPRAAP